METNPLRSLDPTVQTVVLGLVTVHLAVLVRAAAVPKRATLPLLTSLCCRTGILDHHGLLCAQRCGAPEAAVSTSSPGVSGPLPQMSSSKRGVCLLCVRVNLNVREASKLRMLDVAREQSRVWREEPCSGNTQHIHRAGSILASPTLAAS